jgi:hypothetical protein
VDVVGPEAGQLGLGAAVTREEIEKLCGERGLEDILLADGFEEAFIGFAQRFTTTVALYDRAKCIAILESEGATNEEAEEYFEFNVVDAWVGEQTPAFAMLISGGDTSGAQD